MYQNKICIPRLGKRSESLKLMDSLCNGAEWSRIKNIAYNGKLDLGDSNG